MKRITSVLLAGVVTACASTGAVTPSMEVQAPQAAPAKEEMDPRLQEISEALARVREVQIAPQALVLEEGDTALVNVRFLDASGAVIEKAGYGYQFGGGGIQVDRVGPGQLRVIGLQDASGELTVMVPTAPFVFDQGQTFEEHTIAYTVEAPPVARVEIAAPELVAYTGTTLPFHASAFTSTGRERAVDVAWRSTNPQVAIVDRYGNVSLLAPGRATIAAEVEGVRAEHPLEVRRNPVARVDLTADRHKVRTGDVVRLNAMPRDRTGRAVEGARITYALAGPTSSRDRLQAAVYEEGVFVAEKPGVYEVVARVGDVARTVRIEAEPRAVRQDVVPVGHAAVPNAPTSDLWAFTGLDGRDYVYTGTHSGGQKLFAWDITDPAEPVLTDSVVVDARVVNDVKVSKDSRYAVITREGASDRKNGIIVLDLADPAHPTVLSEYTTTLTGGVHNVWLEWPYIYAIHNGTLDVHILDASDPTQVAEVGRWGIDSPGKYLHDINIWDGVGYASYWNDGVYILDFGGAGKGGTPTKPVVVSKLAYPEGNTHHTYRYGKYLFTADEIFGCEECWGGNPRGFIHVIDVSDLENPVEVARYEVPEAGNHNMWIEDGKLYTAYYNAGLRVVDVTGELRGDLYRQGREIGTYLTAGGDDAFRPNAAMAWGAQPFKGNIIVSDLNSGLWVLRMEPRGTEE